MEIAATPATVPPAMAPVFELCPATLYPTGPGIDVVVFEEPPTVYDGRETVIVVLGTGGWGGRELEGSVAELIVLGPVEEEKEEPAGPGIVPGPNSGLSIGSKTGVRQQPGERGRWGKTGEIPTTSGHRIDGVPSAPRLGRTVSVSREESFSNEL